jgi:N-acetylmuramoyl-L-alanine amidase
MCLKDFETSVHYMKRSSFLLLLFGLISLSLHSLSIDIRSYDHQEFTRIVFQGDRGFEYSFNSSKNGVEVRLNQSANVKNQVEAIRRSPVVDRVVHHVEKAGKKNPISVFNIHLKSNGIVKRTFVLEQPFRLVFDLAKAPEKVANSNSHPHQAIANTNANAGYGSPQDPKEKSSDPQVSNPPPQPIQEKEKKRTSITTICLDPGHGGSDEGAVGKSKAMEKDITLKIAFKLKKIIESKLGLYVVMTREKDEEVSLNSRVAKANNQKAQVFVSIHVNSSFRKSANGSETYYVSLKATDQDSYQLSQKENAESTGEGEESPIDKLPAQTNDELKMILWNMAQTEYIKESSVLADYIQGELNVLLDTANRGVKQAPFRVLMRAAMPAVLVEVAFLSNSSEEKKLQNDEFLNNVTSALYTGIAKFISSYNNANR